MAENLKVKEEDAITRSMEESWGEGEEEEAIIRKVEESWKVGEGEPLPDGCE